MARDYTKYTVKGLGENLNKRQLVFQIVKNYVEKNKIYHVSSTLMQSTSFNYFTYNYRPSAVNKSFPLYAIFTFLVSFL